MHVLIVTPASANQRSGNRTTAQRWARLIRGLGHRVTCRDEFDGRRYDLLIALNAHKSARSVFAFRRELPNVPVVVAVTGTDMYRDAARFAAAGRVMAMADVLVTLQDASFSALPVELRAKCHVIYQSVSKSPRRRKPVTRFCKVLVAGHLRPVKDPFRTAFAARNLPASSKIRVVHLGAALTESMEAKALAEMQRNPRYRWLGSKTHSVVRRHMLSSHVMVMTSKLEGGPAVVAEAAVDGLPIISTRVDGVVGMLGSDYPGYFDVGDTDALKGLLLRVESDPRWLAKLQKGVVKAAKRFSKQRESLALKRLLGEFG